MKYHHVSLIALASLIACSPKIDTKGYVKQESLKDRIVLGQTSKQEIIDQFGSPSSQSSFGEDSWYYISNRKETVGFLKPEIVDQDVTRIEFDTAGIATKVDTYDKNNAENVSLVSRETPTEGHQMNFFEQVMGNVGRFNRPGATGTVAGGRQPSSNGGF